MHLDTNFEAAGLGAEAREAMMRSVRAKRTLALISRMQLSLRRLFRDARTSHLTSNTSVLLLACTTPGPSILLRLPNSCASTIGVPRHLCEFCGSAVEDPASLFQTAFHNVLRLPHFLSLSLERYIFTILWRSTPS
jgi:hypothetical protein